MPVKASLNNDTYLKIEGKRDDNFFKIATNQMSAILFGLSETKNDEKQAYEGEIETTDLGEIVDWLDADAPGWAIAGPELKKYFTNRKKQKKTYQTVHRIGKRIKTKKSRLVVRGLAKGFKLLPFQNKPVNHMIQVLTNGGGAANFSVPGAGKTIMTYAAFHVLKQAGIVDQLWVIGPVPSFRPWEDEYKVIFGKDIDITQRIKRYHNISRNKRMYVINQLKDFDVVLTSYGTAGNDLEVIKRNWSKQDARKIMLVLDESHHIKSIKETTGENNNPTTAASMIYLGEFATKRAILSGTPMPHEWDDLYSQFKFLYSGPLPFGERNEFGYMTHEDIEKRIQGLWERVTFNQLKNKLPKILKDQEILVRMNKLQTKIYNFIEQTLVDDFDEGADKWKLEEWKQARTVRILQAVTNPRLILDNDATFGVTKLSNKGKKNREIINAIKKMSKNDLTPKLKEVCRMAEDLATCSGKYKSKDGKKKNVIIYTLFVGNVDILGSDDPNSPGLLLYSSKGVQLDPICITGNNPPKTEQREARINEFKNWNPEKEKCGKILVATLGSIAEAVSLHKNERDEAVCQHVIYLERSYNAGQFMQSKYRVYRIGSDKTKPIQYYFLKSLKNAATGGTVNTIDEDVHVRVRDREREMHRLLSDPMHLVDPVSMEVETHKDKSGRKLPWGPDDTFDEIRNRTIKRMKKKSK